MNKQLNKIRNAVDKALEAKGLDSTRALKFGCKVESPTGIVFIATEFGDTDVRDKDLNVAELKDCKIIGRDITLEDVMLAIDKNRRAFSYIQVNEGGMCEYHTAIDVKRAKWQFGKPYHLQSQETITFISNLINKQHD